MASEKAMIAYAYIKESENPLEIICNSIIYCLSKDAQNPHSFPQIYDFVISELGIKLPKAIVEKCLKLLKKSRKVESISKNGEFKLLEAEFESELYLQQKESLAIKEKLFIDSLIDFVNKEYNVSWNTNDAKKYLGVFFNRDTFYHDTESPESFSPCNEKKITPVWYVEKYIKRIINQKDSIQYKFYSDVLKGKIALTGLLTSNDYELEEKQRFRTTYFYFDTRLILRLLGFSYPYFVESTRELANLIRIEYNGIIGVFPHVISEVQFALMTASSELKKYGYIKDREVQAFQRGNNNTHDDYKIVSNSVVTRLQNEYGIKVTEGIDWNNDKFQKKV